MKKYPILMADILNSSDLPGEKLMQQFKNLVELVNLSRKENIKSPLTITLGDEFQGIIDTFENGIQIIFELEEFIIDKGFDFKLRYVLLEGEIETGINREIAYQMLGSGLTDARNELVELKKSRNRFLIRLDNKQKETYLNKAFNIYRNFVDSWKVKDMDIVREFLKKEDYKSVAKKVNLDPSNAWRREKSLNISEYQDLKEIILILNRHLEE